MKNTKNYKYLAMLISKRPLKEFETLKDKKNHRITSLIMKGIKWRTDFIKKLLRFFP